MVKGPSSLLGSPGLTFLTAHTCPWLGLAGQIWGLGRKCPPLGQHLCTEGGDLLEQQTTKWGKAAPEQGQPLCQQVCARSAGSAHQFWVRDAKAPLSRWWHGSGWGCGQSWAGGESGYWLADRQKASCVETRPAVGKGRGDPFPLATPTWAPGPEAPLPRCSA